MFQYLDDAGTRVSVLAERAHMPKQSGGELLQRLADHLPKWTADLGALRTQQLRELLVDLNAAL